MPVTWRR